MKILKSNLKYLSENFTIFTNISHHHIKFEILFQYINFCYTDFPKNVVQSYDKGVPPQYLTICPHQLKVTFSIFNSADTIRSGTSVQKLTSKVTFIKTLRPESTHRFASFLPQSSIKNIH